jgi:hypothetical protein
MRVDRLVDRRDRELGPNVERRLDRPEKRLAEEATSAPSKMGNQQVVRGQICWLRSPYFASL